MLIHRFGIARPSLAMLRESVHFGSRAWVGSIARFLNFRVDQIMVVFIASEATLGIYAVAVNCSELLFYVPGAVAWVLVPFVASPEEDHTPRRTLHVARGVILVTGVSIVVAALARSLAAPDSVRFCVPSVRHAIPAPAPWSVRLRLHGDLL